MTLTVAGLVVAVVVAMLSAAGIAAGAVWFLSGRIDSSRVEVLARVNQLDSKNETAHAGIVTRVDALAHDITFLAAGRRSAISGPTAPTRGSDGNPCSRTGKWEI